MVAPLHPHTMITPHNPLFRTVRVGAVTGGAQTNPFGTSQISNWRLREALQTSLDLILMRSAHADSAQPDSRYVLEAQIVSRDQPSFTFDVDVGVTIAYRLRRENGQFLYGDQITTRHKATYRDSFLRSEQFRLANEGAVKANVTAFLDRLAAFSAREPAHLF